MLWPEVGMLASLFPSLPFLALTATATQQTATATLSYKFTWFFIYFLFLSDEWPMLETLDHTIRIGSTPTFLYFDLYLYSAYATHNVYFGYSLTNLLFLMEGLLIWR